MYSRLASGLPPLLPTALSILLVSTLYALLRFSPAAKEHNRCSAVQTTGWWLDSARLVWQPQGCTLRRYEHKDLANCLPPDGGHAVFIGDSSIRDKFYAFVRLVDPHFGNQGKVHSDISVKWPATTKVAAQFIWDPYLTSPQTQRILDGVEMRDGGGSTTSVPRVLVLGSGSWYLRNKHESGGVGKWRAMIDSLAQRILASRDPQSTRTIADHVYVNPVPNVVPELLSKDRRETLDPTAIYWMNAYLANSGLSVFDAWNKMTSEEAVAKRETKDGLHYSAQLEDRAINLLLNSICNRRVLSNTKPPFHTTCCFEYPQPSWFVQLFAAATLVAIPWLLFIKRQPPEQKGAGSVWRVLTPAPQVLRCLFAFSAILLLMYINDRTPLFEKLQKHYVGWVFWLLILLALLSGILSWSQDKHPGLLSRDQTDEWKGWMQVAILIYHLMNASTVSYIYNPVRVLVAMYLFMTGYGHFTYFYTKKDYGLRRLTQVLLRLNILAVALAYVMNTSYMDYYFAPLSSAWVLIVWLTMRLWPQANYSRMVWAKIAVSALFFAAMNRWHMWPFGLLGWLGVAWNQREWEFRFGTDIYIVYVGMVAALLKIKYSDALQSHARWAQMKRWAALASALGLLWYLWFEVGQSDKYAYNKWHPYVSPIPTLAFVVLRNCTSYLRSHSSSAHRLIGRISLETFIAQFHLFLAADTKGILVVVDSRLWFVNLLASSVVFIAMCQLLSSATGAIAEWMMKVPDTPGSGDCDIPLTELPTSAGSAAGPRHAVLDRLAVSSESPHALSKLRPRRVLASLAVRWVVGLVILVVLNNIY
ncbi:Cas1p-domain-containing protein [Martensiomyces pterosporus]|nr:Cas1p-domain-containing protein [Martensiomyces pterosporus]